MRAIKFRAWGSETKKMYYQTDSIVFHISGTGSGYWTCADLCKNVCLAGSGNKGKLMQYTGLKDRNGVEVYEGDIVKIDSLSYGSFYATIECLNGLGAGVSLALLHRAKQVEMPTNREWDRPHKPCQCDGAMYEAMSILEIGDTFTEKTEKVEVVGNIYENLELLKD